MASIRSSDTVPERLVRQALFQLGYRYRVNYPHLLGKPDIAFTSRKKAIFVHGCFWHQHGCKRTASPKTNTDYWLPKLVRNKKRDSEVQASLKTLGWQAMIVWECETKNMKRLTARLRRFLGRPRWS